jgi:heptosyltransferase-2
VLARIPDWLGDVVMAEPALRALHERVRELEGSLTLAGHPRLLAIFGDALEGAARVDASHAAVWWGHDAAVLFTNSFRSAWSAVRGRIERRAGFARDLRGWMLTHAFEPALERGRAPVGIGTTGRGRRYLPRPFDATCIELVQWLGCEVRDARPRLQPAPAALTAARARLRGLGLAAGAPFVLANVGARAGSAKGCPAQAWGSALRGLAVPVVLVCGPGEEASVVEVRAAAPDTLACVDPPADLSELTALASLARVVATADSGPRHVANAVRTPLVVVAGPTDPRHTASHTRSTVLLRNPVECGPCHRERCPLTAAAQHRCMRDIASQALRAAIEAQLARA